MLSSLNRSWKAKCSGGKLLLARAPTRPSSSALLYIPVVVAGTMGRTSDGAELVLALTRKVYVCVNDGGWMYGV
jgi:hypothetical protein